MTFKSSSLKPLNQVKANLAGMVLGWSPEDLNVIFYQNIPNLHNLHISAERKIPQKNSDYIVYVKLLTAM
jgi:hypothetical protein